MSTHYHGPKEERLALDAFVKLLRAADTVAGEVNAHLARAGLSVSQFGALEALLHLGPMCQKELAAKLLKSGANITMVVDNLEKRALVRRERGTDDRRLTTVHLTDEGRGLIGDLFPSHVGGVVRKMSILTPAEQSELGRLCRKLGRKAAY